MAVQDTDLLLVQRGNVPYRSTTSDLSEKIRGDLDVTLNGDIPIASATQLGVIRVGTNLDIDGNGILSAVIPAGLQYKGTWDQAGTVPANPTNGDFYIWDGADGAVLTNALWGTANGETINEGDRLFYDGTNWEIIGSGGGGGIASITGTAPIAVDSATDPSQPNISITAASSSDDGYMSSADFDKLAGIESGAEVNVDPTASLTFSATTNTLTLQPGGDTTIFSGATNTVAGLMTAADKQVLDNLVASPGGVLSIVAGDNITVNTTNAPGSAGTPEVSVTPNSFIPYDLNDLTELP